MYKKEELIKMILEQYPLFTIDYNNMNLTKSYCLKSIDPEYLGYGYSAFFSNFDTNNQDRYIEGSPVVIAFLQHDGIIYTGEHFTFTYDPKIDVLVGEYYLHIIQYKSSFYYKLFELGIEFKTNNIYTPHILSDVNALHRTWSITNIIKEE